MLKGIGFHPDEVGGGQWRPGWTQSLVPSAQFSFFQMGTSVLINSMASRQASKAAARWGALAAMTTEMSPM